MGKKRNGNPQTENGFIRISNELWDAWMCSRFTAREERMIKVVIRFSYGMNRTFALLSKSDLARFMNEHLPNVDGIMKSLLARGVIRVESPGSKGPLRLSLNKRYREWRVDQALQKDPDFFGKWSGECLATRASRMKQVIDLISQVIRLITPRLSIR